MILTILWRPPESREVASFSLQKLLTEAIVPFNPMVVPNGYYPFKLLEYQMILGEGWSNLHPFCPV